MKVLYCSYEVAPFFKKGGLGDVAGSLPKALAKLGVDVGVVMPEYKLKIKNKKLKIADKKFKIKFADQEEIVGVWESVLPGSKVPIYFLENERYLTEVKQKEAALEQFAFFSKAIVEFARYTLQADLVHLNDWHTALVALLLKLRGSKWEVGRLRKNGVSFGKGKWERPATLLTIHNFSHQGIAPLNILAKLGISQDLSRVISWDIADGNFEMLMEGIIHSDIVNTVSPSYAKEILEPKVLGKLSEVLKGKEGRVKGILNGIDYDVWNPETDEQINFKFQISNFKEGKRINKLALQKELGLEINRRIPLLAFIGRLAQKQKGLDILYKMLAKLLPKKEFQFVLLGKGSKTWEKKFKELEEKVKLRHDRSSVLPFRALVRFDELLAHRIYAGADFVLVPSRFEPCGLIPMIAMRYGTLPIVRKTGGLADSVKDGENGFVFEKYSAEALAECVKRALNMPVASGPMFKEMVKQAMKEDFSWKKSAREYLKLYQKAITLSK